MILRDSLFIALICLLKLGGIAQQVDNYSSPVITQNFNDKTLGEFMETMTQDYNVSFAYPANLNTSIKIKSDLYNSSLFDALESVFSNLPIDYKIAGTRQILLRNDFFELEEADHKNYNYLIIKGQIFSSIGEALADVAIFYPGSSVGTFTNGEGKFTLSLPYELKEELLHISLLGYKRTTIKAEYFLKEPQLKLSFESLQIPEISILSSPSSLRINSDQQFIAFDAGLPISKIASPAGSDLLRSVQLLAGVAAHNDDSADLIIRGSGQDNHLLILDGIPIYNAQHYYGIFSGINEKYIDEIKLYKNALPIDYGGKIGGLLLLSSKNRIDKRPSFNAELNLLTASINSSIPIANKVSFQFAARTSLLNAADNDLFNFADNGSVVENFNVGGGFSSRILQNIPDFSFSDYNARLLYNPSTGNQLSLNFYRSGDQYDNSFSNSFSTRTQNGPFQYSEEFADRENWSNIGFSAMQYFKLAENITLDGNFYYSKYKNDHFLLSSLNRSNGIESNETLFKITEENMIEKKGAQLSSTINFSKALKLQVGIFAEENRIKFDIGDSNTSLLDGDKTAWTSGGFLESALKHKSFYLSFGVRGSLYSETNNLHLSPRIQLSQQISERFKLKSSFDISQQFETQLSYENRLGQTLRIWLLSNGDAIPVRSSDNIMVGGNYIFDLFSLDVEFYKKTTDGILEFALRKPGIGNNNGTANRDDYRLFTGKGESYGMDLMLKFERKFYQGWIAYTLSKVNNSFSEVFGGKEFPDENDRRHQFKWINSISVDNWTFSGNLVYSSGKAYTNYSILNGDIDRKDLSPDQRISRLPHYSRIDLGAEYKFRLSDTGISIGTSVYNLLNRQNVKYLQYIFSVPNLNPQNNKLINTVLGSESNLLDRTLNFNLKIEL